MKGIFLTLCALALVLSVACTAASRETPGASTGASAAGGAALAGNAAEGKTQFTKTCAACHGPNAKGLPNLGKDLTASTFVKGQNDTQLMAFIKKGRPASDPANTTGVDMPPKGGNPAITDKNLTDIIAFIRSVHQ